MCWVSTALQEAVSTGDPEMVQLVLQRRDYLKASTALGGVPELLAKIREVRLLTPSLMLTPSILPLPVIYLVTKKKQSLHIPVLFHSRLISIWK